MSNGSEDGQGLVEYSLIIVLIAIFVIVLMTIISPAIPKVLDELAVATREAPRYLQIIALILLAFPILLWLIRLAPQLPTVLGLDVRQIEVADRTYEEIKTYITRDLLTDGKAHGKHYGVSRGVWKLAAAKYLRTNPDLEVSFSEKTRFLVAANSQSLLEFNRLWREGVETKTADALLPGLHLLADNLKASIKPIPQQIFDEKTSLYLLDLASWNSPLPAQLPLIVWSRESLLQDREIEALRTLLADLGISQRIALFFDLFSLSSVRSETVSQELSRLRQVYAFDLVPLTWEDSDLVLLAYDRRAKLSNLILPNVDLISISPFVLTGPAPENVFFGRETEMRQIIERPGSHALIGGRRYGKSSILLRLHHVRLPAANYLSIYHDCSTTPDYQSFLAATIRDWRPGPPADPPLTFDDLFQCLERDRASLGNRSLVLLLDEADKLVPAERAGGWQLFKTLRSLQNSNLARFVLSGERTLRDALKEPTSPLFNFTNEMLIGRMGWRPVEELITQPMRQLKVEFEESRSITKLIYGFTSGHPNIVQRLCHRLIEHVNREGSRIIRVADVNAVIEDPGFQRDDFLSTYWEAATPLEKLLSLLIAQDPKLNTLAGIRQELKKQCDVAPRVKLVDSALQRLVDLRGILRRTPEGYDFAVEAFPRVIAGTITLQDMLDILVEEYREKPE